MRYFYKERSSIAELFKEFSKYLNNSPLWRKILGPSPVSRICIQTDNAPELTSEEIEKSFTLLFFQHRFTADYVHTDNFMVENAIRNIDRVLRKCFAAAPWLPYTTWPGAISFSVDLLNIWPTKVDNKLQLGPLLQLTGQTEIQQPQFVFGQLVKMIKPIEKRRQISIVPKMIPQAGLGYYLCKEIDSARDYIYSLESHVTILANKIEMVKMDFTFKNTVASCSTIQSPFFFPLPPGHIDKLLLTFQKQVTVQQVLNIGVHIDTNTGERYGVVEALLINSKVEKAWVMLEIFFKGRKDRCHIHRKLLNQFLDKYFAHRKNEFHPLFVRTEIKVDDKKQNRISSSVWPAIITSFDSTHILPIGAALFNDDEPTVCDMHDCKIIDVKALNETQSISSLEQFCNIPPTPKQIKDIDTYPEPYRTMWRESVIRELRGIVVEREGLTACTKEYMCKYLKEHPESYVLNFLPVFKEKLDGRSNRGLLLTDELREQSCRSK